MIPEEEVIRLKKKVNELRQIILESDKAGINFHNSGYGGYLWRAVIGVVHKEQDEDVPAEPPKQDILRSFAIWSEGFHVIEGRSGATFWGTMEGTSFKEACDALAKINSGFRDSYDPVGMDHWGCKLYDNEADARRTFG